MHPDTKLLPTAHALQRWNERFPFEDLLTHWATAIPCGKKMRARIKKTCPRYTRFVTASVPYVYLFDRYAPNVVFVTKPVAAGRFLLITVLDLAGVVK